MKNKDSKYQPQADLDRVIYMVKERMKIVRRELKAHDQVDNSTIYHLEQLALVCKEAATTIAGAVKKIGEVKE